MKNTLSMWLPREKLITKTTIIPKTWFRDEQKVEQLDLACDCDVLQIYQEMEDKINMRFSVAKSCIEHMKMFFQQYREAEEMDEEINIEREALIQYQQIIRQQKIDAIVKQLMEQNK